MKTYDHIVRFTVLIIVVILGFFFVRSYLIPDSFGVHGSYTYAYYRADSEKEQASLPVVYQGAQHCNACHAPQAAILKGSGHATLDCESCHGSFKAHNNNTRGRMAVSETDDACMTCHAGLAARPAGFPQIAGFAEHAADQGETLRAGMTCTTCHNPHAPM
jgi:hypothetical protein